MRLWKLCAALAPVTLGLAVSSAANATVLLGNTVNYDYGFTPLGGFAYVGPSEGNYLVGPGIEISNVEGVATMDLSDTNILIDFTQTNHWTPTTFNGFRL